MQKDAMPDYAIIDPNIIKRIPRELTIFTGLDTFSHAFECYTSIIANPLDDVIAEKALEMTVKYLPIAVKDGSNQEDRNRMAIAAALGGWLLTESPAHVGHAIAHSMESALHFPHGAACSYSLPPVIEFIAPAVPEKVKYLGSLLGVEYTGNETGAELGAKTADAYRYFRDEILGTKKFAEWNPDVSKVDLIIDFVAAEPVCGFSPVEVTHEAAEKLVKKVFEGLI